MESHYKKIYSGNLIVVQLIRGKLEEIGIIPILKEDMQTGLSAVLVSDHQGLIEVYVHEDELEQATEVVEKTLAGMEA